jgi:hypothetical protein
MRRHVPVLIAVLFLLSGPVRAEVIAIHVPGLAGSYPVSPGVYTRTVTIQLPKLPTLIHGASFWIFGSGAPGVADCGNPGQADIWPMEYIAEMADGAGGVWMAYHEPYYLPGQFIRAADFEGMIGGESWDFLMDGAADVTLSGAPASALGGCDPVLIPSGNIFDAYFYLDAEFVLAVEPTTWGKVKALYR